MEGIGSSINDFDLSKKKLGSGAFGEVFEAKCLKDGFEGRRVAIKQISKNLVSERKIEKEKGLHSQLRDDTIVQLYTSFRDENYWYLVMELCDGGSLEKYLEKKKKLSETEACHIIKQVIDAVYCLHGRYKIIHRDLSLRNILLKNEKNEIGENYYQVKIADFGLACQLENEKKTERVGTLDFMAPEVYRQQPYDFKSDWWSVGCILFALLYGHPPFKQKKKKEINYKALNSMFPSDASEEAKELLRALLKENPDKRIGFTDCALEYNFFKKYQVSGDSCLNLDSSDGPLHFKLNKRTPRNYYNYSNQNPSCEFRKTSYSKENIVDKYSDLEYTKPKVQSDNLVRSNSRRIMSSEQSKRNISDLGSTYKSKVEALPSQNESHDEMSKQTDIFRRVRSCKSTNYHVSNLSEHERLLWNLENSIHQSNSVNQLKPKIQTSTSSKISYNGSFSKQMLSDNKYHMNQSNLRHKLRVNDELYVYESHYDPSVNTCPESLPYPSEIQNITEQNWKANSHDSGHCASDENMHVSNTHKFQGSVQRNSSHSYNKRYTPEVENKQEICRKNKALDKISTARLRNWRKKLNNFVCSVFDDDDGKKQVCLEVFKKSEEKELLSCALFISHDSKEIMVFKPKKKIMISDKPPSINLNTKKSKHEVEYFSLENLPEKYWKRYQCAKLFVDTIKAQTPKVIYYKEFGKCIMMENTPNPDFEMHFYDGYKITESKGKITIYDGIGNDVTKKGNHENMLNNFDQMKSDCRLTEQLHETYLGVFPVVVGRSNGKLRNQDSNKENSNPRTMQSSLMSGGSALKSFDITLNTNSSASQFSSLKSQSSLLPSEQSNISFSKVIKTMENLEPGQLEKIHNYIQNMNLRPNK